MANPKSPNWIIPTAPTGTSDNRAASTQFVTAAGTALASSIATRGYGAFLVTLAASTAIGTGSFKIAFDTKVFDVDSTYNLGTNKWIPAQPGFYFVGLQTYASQSPANGTQEAFVLLNGATYVFGTWQNFNATSVVSNVTTMVHISTNTDFVEGYITSGAAGTAISETPPEMGTFMYGFRVV